jgi:acetyl-CoA acyltransferase
MSTSARGSGNGVPAGDRVAVVAGLRTPFTKAGTALRALRTVDLATAVV